MEGPVTALAAGAGGLWAVAGDHALWHSDGGAWEPVAEVTEHRFRCILPTGDGVLVGTSGAHLLRITDGSVEQVMAFDRAPGRESWYTPWGGPPDTRSLSAGSDGTVYANVHVGGILRSGRGQDPWEPTIDIDADIHQVLVHPGHPAMVLAAGAVGLAASEDGGATWRIETEGLHARYARAVAVAGETVLLSASTGPFSDRAALYRVPFAGPPGFERCTQGLPEWFPSNIDSHCLAAADGNAAFGTGEGTVYRSDDEGRSWEEAAVGLPPIRAVAILPS